MGERLGFGSLGGPGPGLGSGESGQLAGLRHVAFELQLEGLRARKGPNLPQPWERKRTRRRDTSPENPIRCTSIESESSKVGRGP